MTGSESERYTGTVATLKDKFGWLETPDLPGESIWFHQSWFKGTPPLEVGDRVAFQLKYHQEKPQAHFPERIESAGKSMRLPSTESVVKSLKPSSEYLFDWAYLGWMPDVLEKLKGLALEEDWNFQNAPEDPEKPHPILFSYLIHTFGRLVHEDKVEVSTDGSLAAFNTGLVDDRYEPIYALLVPNPDPRADWRLKDFVISGEGYDGKNLVRYFSPLPRQAHYFDDPADLLYDVRLGPPELDWDHIVIDNIGRFPVAFLEDNCPSGFQMEDASSLDGREQKAYFDRIGAAIRSDRRTYRSIINRVRDAVDLSIKRVSWNFKTAIPQYYPKARALTLLLPICLVADDRVDLALAVERTPSGNYLGHTILTLDWAYKNARLICRPDSDWLNPEDIAESGADQDLD